MKRMLALTLILALAALAAALPATAGTIEPRLETEFSKKGAGANVSIIVRLKSQVVFKDVPAPAPNRAAYVKKSLMSHARISQKPLVDYMRSIDPKFSYESLWITNAIVTTVDRETALMIASRPEVDSVYLNGVIKLDTPLPAREIAAGDSPNEWNVDIVNVPAVWSKYNLRGEGVKIGHIDTGCEGSHPDVAGKIYAFRDFISGKNDVPYDDQGHGTHTVGTIMGGNASGKNIGVAPNATIAVAKVFDKGGSAQDANIMKAMQWIMDPDDNPATNDVPRLVSNSWGTSELSKTFWDIVNNWRAANIYPLFAAGNSGPSPRTVGTPGGLPHAIAVGATNRSEKAASFSSRGPVVWDGVTMIKPDISAPGEDIKSAVPGGKWGIKSGTSMATPLVAGVMTLLYQAKPDISIDDMTQVLETTGADLGDPGKDNNFGSCRIDAYQAVTRVLNSGVLAITVTGISGAPLAAKVVINDKIKLETKPDGTLKSTLEAGNYKVSVSCFGYISETVGATVEKDKINTLAIKMKQAPLSNIVGTVTDKTTGAPLAANAFVVDTNVAPVQTDPKTGRFAISLPAGEYKVKVVSFKYKTEIVPVSLVSGDAKIAVELVALPPALLVADTTDGKLHKFYRDALTAAGIGHTYHDPAAAGDVTTDLLIQYPLVVWFTGSESGKTLTDADQNALTAYLNAGGALLLTGQDIGYELKGKKFYTENLKAKYESDASKLKKITVTEAVPEFAGASYALDGADSANNQQYPDVVTALAPAEMLFYYDSPGQTKQGAGLVYKTDAFRLVYMGFGIEGIQGAANRADFVKRAARFLIPGYARNLGSLAAAESRLAETGAANDLRSVADLECAKISADILNSKYDRFNAFMVNFEKRPDAHVYRVIAEGLRSSLINSGSNSPEVKKCLEKLGSALNGK